MKHLGPISKKILLLIETGFVLSLTHSPNVYFKILKTAAREWKKINEHNLRRTIKRLYQSKLIDYKEDADGIVNLTLTTEGRKRILRYMPDNMTIKKPSRWDGLWRLVMFDIPEKKSLGRVAFRKKLKDLGFHPIQKSVFIHPYECKDEIDFIVEIFNLTPYIRFARVKDIDTELDLKKRFNLV